MKTGAPSRIFKNGGMRWFKNEVYCWPWQYVSMLSRISIAWANLARKSSGHVSPLQTMHRQLLCVAAARCIPAPASSSFEAIASKL